MDRIRVLLGEIAATKRLELAAIEHASASVLKARKQAPLRSAAQLRYFFSLRICF
jgi:hypothetical protein